MATGSDNCAAMLKVLADDTRLAVVRRLMSGPQQVSEIIAVLHLEQSLLSHHLRVLRDAGLVESERDGKAVRYRLAEQVFGDARAAIDLGCCSILFDER